LDRVTGHKSAEKSLLGATPPKKTCDTRRHWPK